MEWRFYVRPSDAGKEEALTLILLYLFTNNSCGQNRKLSLSSGWVRHCQRWGSMYLSFHGFFPSAEGNQVTGQTPEQVKPVDTWMSCPCMWCGDLTLSAQLPDLCLVVASDRSRLWWWVTLSFPQLQTQDEVTFYPSASKLSNWSI